MSEITHINTEYGVAFICNNCGAHAFGGLKNIQHHTTCTPGESKKWEDFYNEQDEEDEEDEEEEDPPGLVTAYLRHRELCLNRIRR